MIPVEMRNEDVIDPRKLCLRSAKLLLSTLSTIYQKIMLTHFKQLRGGILI